MSSPQIAVRGCRCCAIPLSLSRYRPIDHRCHQLSPSHCRIATIAVTPTCVYPRHRTGWHAFIPPPPPCCHHCRRRCCATMALAMCVISLSSSLASLPHWLARTSVPTSKSSSSSSSLTSHRLARTSALLRVVVILIVPTGTRDNPPLIVVVIAIIFAPTGMHVRPSLIIVVAQAGTDVLHRCCHCCPT